MKPASERKEEVNKLIESEFYALITNLGYNAKFLSGSDKKLIALSLKQMYLTGYIDCQKYVLNED